MLQTVVASAQKNIETIFKIVLNDPATNILASSDYDGICADDSVSYCKFIEFTIPTKQKKLFREIEKVILIERPKAYNVFIQKPGYKGTNRFYTSYIYGANNEYKVKLGGNNSHSYYGLCFKAANDPLRRHAYLYVWYKEGNNYHCYYYHIYGVIPSRFDELKSRTNASNKSVTKSTTVRTKTYTDGDMVITSTYDSDGNVTSMQSSTGAAMMNNVKTDIDFMLQFGNLRAAFLDAIKDANAKTLQTGIVVKIARLCKEHGKLLTDNEKKTCISSLDEMNRTMMKTNQDSFMSGMLQEAKNTLGK